MKLLRRELLARPKGWPPAIDREIAAWIANTLGPVVVVGDGVDAALRMSAGDMMAYLLRWR